MTKKVVAPTADKISLYIIKEAREKKISDVSPLKLQKLLYLAYVDYVHKHDKPLFKENFEVWRHGPVVRSVYDAYKRFGSEVISNDTSIIENELDKDIKDSISNILKRYGGQSAWNLVEETHKEDGIWYDKMEKGASTIEFEDVKGHPA